MVEGQRCNMQCIYTMFTPACDNVSVASDDTNDGDAPGRIFRPPEDDPLALGSGTDTGLQVADEREAQAIRVEVVDWADAARQVWLRLCMCMTAHCLASCRYNPMCDSS
jgi:hypothetical protein